MASFKHGENISISGGGSLAEIFKEFANITEIEVLTAADVAGKTTANNTVKTLKATSPKGKRYAKGWRVKKENKIYYVYQEAQPSLTHLLNNGHDIIKNGVKVGRAAGDNHIGKAEETAKREFVEETIKEINRRLNT